MPTWDDAKPRGSIPLKQFDDEVRDQFAVVKDALLREHIFPGTYNVDAGIHSEGSARLWVGLDGDKATSSGAKATSTGMLYYATDTGRLYVCTDGANDTWVEIASFGAALQIVGALTVAGGLVVPSGKTIQGPQGENWLSNGVDQMDPISHASRHITGNDKIPGIIVEVGEATGPKVPDPNQNFRTLPVDQFFNVVSAMVDTSAWGTTHIFVAFMCPPAYEGGSTWYDVEAVIRVDGTDIGPWLRMNTHKSTVARPYISLVSIARNVPPGWHTLSGAVQVHDNGVHAYLNESALYWMVITT